MILQSQSEKKKKIAVQYIDPTPKWIFKIELLSSLAYELANRTPTTKTTARRTTLNKFLDLRSAIKKWSTLRLRPPCTRCREPVWSGPPPGSRPGSQSIFLQEKKPSAKKKRGQKWGTMISHFVSSFPPGQESGSQALESGVELVLSYKSLA